jgi:hypothetical protein
MFAHELFEQNKPRVIVTYPGRFQPFHQGHAGVFAQLQKKFGSENVYVLTSNDTSSEKSPFNFADKYQLITAAGIPGNHIVETNKMYVLPEEFDPTTTIFITAVGSPDANRLNPDSVTKRDQKDKEGNVTKPAGSPGYYKTWSKDHNPVTADQHGYVVVIPEIKKSIKIKGKMYDVSHGTECRNLWNLVRNDTKAKSEFLSQMYARPSQELAAIYDKIPESVGEDIDPVTSDSTSPIHGKLEETGGVGVIASKKQAKDPRYSNSLTVDVKPGAIQKNLRAFRLAESDSAITYPEMADLIAKFLPIAGKELKLTKFPHIKIEKNLTPHGGQATFGRFVNEEVKIYLGIANRHPVDILRTLAHELVHFKQFLDGEMYPAAGETGSPIENEANAVAGIIMRHFNLKYPNAIDSKPLEL